MAALEVDRIFWRNVTPGDYFNVEKVLPQGARGQLHIDLAPSGPVEEFLGIQPKAGEKEEHSLPDVGVVGDPTTAAPIQFNKRPNGRWNFPQQNFRDPDSMRHPAWTPEYGWPRDPQNPPAGTQDGETALASVDGVHVYVVRTVDGRHFAGITVGDALPLGWPSVLEPLFVPQSKRTGCIRSGNSGEGMSALAMDILAAFSRKKNVLVYGPPGTGKTHAVSQVYRYLEGGSTTGLQVLTIDPSNATSPFSMSGAESPLPPPTRTDWVTFHQDYGYEDFMVGLRPTGSGFGLEPVAGRMIDVAMDVSQGPSSSGLVVVDEINRGNVPKILGDFLTYMDDDYREGGGSPIEVRLPKVKGDPADPKQTEPLQRLDGSHSALPLPWWFPREVYLLATMNSVDRAVAPLDTALGRRFERIDAMPDLEVLAVSLGIDLADVDALLQPPSPTQPMVQKSDLEEGEADGDVDEEGAASVPIAWSAPLTAVTLLRYLNDEIAERLGTDFELGHVYFFGVGDWRRLAQVWDLQIWPQLRDRFGARPDQLAEILRADKAAAPVGYPFKRRRPGGKALTVTPMAGMGDGAVASAFRYLCTGRP